jgi:hypothetical protein
MLLILGMGIEAEAAEVVEPVPGHVLGTGRSAPIVDPLDFDVPIAEVVGIAGKETEPPFLRVKLAAETAM